MKSEIHTDVTHSDTYSYVNLWEINTAYYFRRIGSYIIKSPTKQNPKNPQEQVSNTQHPKIPRCGQWDCSNCSYPLLIMLREANSEHDYIRQTITDGNLMETVVLQPAWDYTTIHRTFCAGHSSRRQHKQWIRVRQGCCRIVLNIQFLVTSPSSAHKKIPPDVPSTAIRNSTMTDWRNGAALCHFATHSLPLAQVKEKKNLYNSDTFFFPL